MQKPGKKSRISRGKKLQIDILKQKEILSNNVFKALIKQKEN